MWVGDPYREGRQVLYEFEDAPYTEERVAAYAALFARGEGSLCSLPDDPGIVALARVYAQKEANGLCDFEEMEEAMFPRRRWEAGATRVRLIRMREEAPEGREVVVLGKQESGGG